LVVYHSNPLPCFMIIDPGVWEQPDMRRVLAAHDISAVYRALRDLGISQRQIAALTGQSQSEVSEILQGRQVRAYDVLVRIAEGLGIPRELMGLSWWAADGTGTVNFAICVAGMIEGLLLG
jgi:Helix-turn-helix domain